MRIPRLGKKLLKGITTSFSEMDDTQIKLFARRHAFAGYTRLQHENGGSGRPVCTRHHCIDWNYVGVPRPRPNKWYVEMHPDQNTWKEWAYAKDNFDQHYYWERWERLQKDGNGNGFVLALRKERNENDDRDGIIVVVGDHFNYILGRDMSGKEKKTFDKSSTVDLVDAAIDAGDRTTAETYLSIDAGHGLISKGWEIDCALQHWKEGSKFFADASIQGSDIDSCKIFIDKCTWEVYECSVDLKDLETVLQWKGNSSDGHFDFDSILLGSIGKKRNATCIETTTVPKRR